MQGPLSGIKVIELAMWVAGPSTAAVLSDWGADVIKLEDPSGGDPVRGGTSAIKDRPGERIASTFELDNRNKRSVALDLRNQAGREFALRLIDKADVFVTSLRLDALARMGLDYDSLSARNPLLIYAALTGYGDRGPDRDRGAFDYAAAWSRSGLMAAVAEPGSPPPAQRPAMIDHPAGLSLAGAVSAALFSRTRTGRGQFVHLSLFAMGLWMNSADLTAGLLTGNTPQPESRKQRVNPLWNSYVCKDGKWMYFVLLQSDRHWPDFCAALGHLEWRSDSRFTDHLSRVKHSRELTALIDDAMAQRTLEEWSAILDNHNLFWAPVQAEPEVLEDKQAEAIGAFVRVDHPSHPDYRLVRSPVDFSAHRVTPRTRAPELGQHNEEVALECGLDWSDIERLRKSGAFGV